MAHNRISLSDCVKLHKVIIRYTHRWTVCALEKHPPANGYFFCRCRYIRILLR